MRETNNKVDHMNLMGMKKKLIMNKRKNMLKMANMLMKNMKNMLEMTNMFRGKRAT